MSPVFEHPIWNEPRYFTPEVWWLLVIGMGCVLWLVWSLCFSRLRGVSQRGGVQLRAIAFLVGTAVCLARVSSVTKSMTHPDHPLTRVLLMAAGVWLLVLAGTSLGVLFFQTWVGGQLTPEEASTGRAGVRAWLRGGNLLMAALVAVGGWLGYGWPLVVTGLLALLGLLAYPFASTFINAAPPPVVETMDDTAAHKERVLRMLEQGRITAAESADLLSALGASAPPPQNVQAAKPVQNLSIVGALLVSVGFLLPWLSFNPGRESQRLFEQMGGLGEQFGAALNRGAVGGVAIQSIHVAGGGIANGLGWIILVAALAAVVLPMVQLRIDARTQRMVTWSLLGIGGFLLLYVLTQNLRMVSIGILIVIAGYALEAVGLAREYGHWTGRSQVTVTPGTPDP